MNGQPLGVGSIITEQRIAELRRAASTRRARRMARMPKVTRRSTPVRTQRAPAAS